jgi:hypothetical protein
VYVKQNERGNRTSSAVLRPKAWMIANELDAAKFDPLRVRSVVSSAKSSLDILFERVDSLIVRGRTAALLLKLQQRHSKYRIGHWRPSYAIVERGSMFSRKNILVICMRSCARLVVSTPTAWPLALLLNGRRNMIKNH